MEAAVAHGMMLVLAAVAFRLGWYMKQNPEKASRLFTFGTRPMFAEALAIHWMRMVGWLFTIVGALGVVLYLVVIPIDLLRPA